MYAVTCFLQHSEHRALVDGDYLVVMHDDPERVSQTAMRNMMDDYRLFAHPEPLSWNEGNVSLMRFGAFLELHGYETHNPDVFVVPFNVHTMDDEEV